MKNTNRGFAPLVAIIIAVVVVAALGVGYVVLKPKPVPEIVTQPPVRSEEPTPLPTIPTPTPPLTPTPTPPPAPILKVISPNGGEVWYLGSTYTIKWTAPLSVQTVNIILTPFCPATVACYAEIYTLAEHIPNTGSYTWTASNNTRPGSYWVAIASDSYSDRSDNTLSITQ